MAAFHHEYDKGVSFIVGQICFSYIFALLRMLIATEHETILDNSAVLTDVLRFQTASASALIFAIIQQLVPTSSSVT